jgi:polygalacturonase
MSRSHLIQWCLVLNILVLESCTQQTITPNQFEGNDIQRIRSAIEAAKTSTRKVTIPSRNANGTNIWLLDSAILIPGNMTILLDNCTIQLSDQCRDNMFRSDNVGIGISDPVESENISIIGMGDVILKGADNPRATGDGARTLTLNPAEEKEKGNWRVSYGSDAGKEGKKQKGDWRNIMILMAHIDGFKLKNINIENSHAWAVSFERVKNADISGIRIDNPEEIKIDGKKVLVSNKDGINLRHGCKNFRIDNISGRTGDDFIALSSLDTGADGHDTGNLDSASIHDVYIDGLICREWNGYTNSILIGGIGYGKPSHPGKINNIYAMNITGSGRSLILIEAAIADCSFINGIYTGDGDQIITYKIDKSKTTNIISRNLIKAH